MSAAKHTLGPWAVERGTGVHEGWHVITARHVGMGPNTPLAKLSPILDAVDGSAAADARLIAAAPALLEALREAETAMVAAQEAFRKRREIQFAKAFDRPIREVRAAIKRATEG